MNIYSISLLFYEMFRYLNSNNLRKYFSKETKWKIFKFIIISEDLSIIAES